MSDTDEEDNSAVTSKQFVLDLTMGEEIWHVIYLFLLKLYFVLDVKVYIIIYFKCIVCCHIIWLRVSKWLKHWVWMQRTGMCRFFPLVDFCMYIMFICFVTVVALYVFYLCISWHFTLSLLLNLSWVEWYFSLFCFLAKIFFNTSSWRSDHQMQSLDHSAYTIVSLNVVLWS